MSDVTGLLSGEEFEGEDTLVGIGQSVVPELSQILGDETQPLVWRGRAAVVAGKIGATELATQLALLLSHPARHLRCFAARGLELMANLSLVPVLRDHLDHEEICVRESMARALGSVGRTRADLDALLAVALHEASMGALSAQRQAVVEIQAAGLSGVIRGTVASAAGGPIGGVIVTLSAGTSAMTDAEGGYWFGHLPPGSFTVTISGFDSALGFPDTSLTVALGDGDEEVLDFTAP